MKNSISINVELTAGTDIMDAAIEGTELADRLGVMVCFLFNTVHCICRPGEDYTSLPIEYEIAQESKRPYKFASTKPKKEIPDQPKQEFVWDDKSKIELFDKIVWEDRVQGILSKETLEKIAAIKNQLSKSTPPSQAPKNDWEILEIKEPAKIDVTRVIEIAGHSSFDEYVNDALKKGATIHSVRRTSDNTTWTVGGEIDHTNGFGPAVIESFYINNKKKMACVVKNEMMQANWYMGNWKKISQSPPTESKQEERITVDLINELDFYYPIRPQTAYTLWSSKPIQKEKFPAIKQAIEKILNGKP